MATADKIGIVIGTFGSVHHVHLQLEQWRRYSGQAHLLVHDDCSNRRTELIELCNHYGAAFMTPSVRCGHYLGDVMAMRAGLEWAQVHRFEGLVKISRRLVPLTAYVDYVCSNLDKCGTLYSRDSNWANTVRSEFIVMNMAAWSNKSVLDALDAYADSIKGKAGMLAEPVEMAVDRLAQQAAGARDPAMLDWFMGANRQERNNAKLWHDCNSSTDYATLSQSLQLPYTRQDYESFPY